MTRAPAENEIEILPVTRQHIVEFERLRPLHKDPFDRMLVAQATTEQIPVISKDAHLRRYPIEVIW